MQTTANTVREVIRRGVMLTPPEAFALWKTALANDPEGCAEFALNDNSGLAQLVRLGGFGYATVPLEEEFHAAELLGQAVFFPSSRLGYTLVRQLSAVPVALNYFHTDGVARDVLLGFVSLYRRRETRRSVLVWDTLMALGMLPELLGLRGVVGFRRVDRVVLVYG